MASDPASSCVYFKTEHEAHGNVSNVKLENSEKQPEISASVRETGPTHPGKATTAVPDEEISTSTDTTNGPDTLVSVFIKTTNTKEEKAAELKDDLKGQPEEELEFKEEVGGYEDDEEEGFEDAENDENVFVEMDEEGGYEDEDEEGEEC